MDKFNTGLAVRNWVWRAYPPQEGKRVKSLLAEDIRKSYLEGWGQMLCGEVAIVFKEALETVGVTARHFEIGCESNPIAHFGVEVWIGKRWAVMEAMQSLSLPAFCYTPEARVASAWDLHQGLVREQCDKVAMVLMRGFRMAPEGVPMDYLKNFHYVRIVDGPLSGYYKDEENAFDRWNCTIEPKECKSGLTGRSKPAEELWGPPYPDLTHVPVRDISRLQCWDMP